MMLINTKEVIGKIRIESSFLSTIQEFVIVILPSVNTIFLYILIQLQIGIRSGF